MYDRIKEYIEKNRMLEGIERVVVGLSGGADSVCLLFMLYRYICEHNENAADSKISLIAVHVHHGIRGDEADADAGYCSRLCERMMIEYRQYSFDVPRIAGESGEGEEETGRNLRYKVFRENAGNDGRGVIAVAHHQNDQAETVLFHIARGSFLSGGRGMEPVSGDVIRPLLCVSRGEIEGWLQANDIRYCTDNTNFTEEYARNSIRLKVIPYLEEHVNKGTVANICRYAEGIALVNDYISEQTKAAYGHYVEEKQNEKGYAVIVSAGLVGEHPVICRAVIYDILKRLCGAKDLEDKHVMLCVDLLSKQSGKRINLPKSITAVKNYDGIVFCNMSNTKPETDDGSRIVSTIIDCDDVDENVHFDELLCNIIDKNLMNDNCTKFFDYGKIKKYIVDCTDGEELCIRHRTEGDYMVTGYHEPEHRAYTKKLKEIFIDSKIPADKRDSVLLCAIGSRILWAAGVRRCAEFLVDKDTGTILKLELVQEQR